jgi:hypothetical protein
MDRKLYLVSITVEGLRVVGWLIWTIQMMTRVMKGDDTNDDQGNEGVAGRKMMNMMI